MQVVGLKRARCQPARCPLLPPKATSMIFMFHSFIFHVSTNGIEVFFSCDHIVFKKLWQPLVSFFRHGIRISNNGSHVQDLVEVFCPRMSHWCKWEMIVEKSFDKGGVKWRLSSINLGRLEPSKGKGLLGRRNLRWWSRQMSFSSSRKERERELPSSGVAKQARGKGFGIKACQSVVRARKRIQNLPRQRRQNVIAQIVG
jgi:hypothetical protein